MTITLCEGCGVAAALLHENLRKDLAAAHDHIKRDDVMINGLFATIEAREQMLGDLLAIIHRDGGDYKAKHGTQKAVEAAHKIWGELQLQVETAQADAAATLKASMRHVDGA